MSDEFKVQWSISLPPAAQYAKGDMLNLRGNTVDEVDQLFDAVLENDSSFLVKAANVGALLRSCANVVDPGSGEKADAGPQDSGPSNTTHVCAHGKRVYKTGTGRKGKWEAWFCAAPKDASDKCDPVWVD